MWVSLGGKTYLSLELAVMICVLSKMSGRVMRGGDGVVELMPCASIDLPLGSCRIDFFLVVIGRVVLGILVTF